MSRNTPATGANASSTVSKNNERNEYIPSFISKKPFYIDESISDADYLEHQRIQSSQPSLSSSKWYDRGKKVGPAATKFRKGACENCGAMTHKTKECLSRPRKAGAKWTGKDIQADEKIESVQLGWDAKRDRWNGYDPSEYKNVVAEYEELEALKKRLKKGGEEQGLEDEDGEEGATEEAKYAEESDMGRQQSTATRNLRLREDTAKYLLNLDLESAKYDTKSRSMVDMGAQSDQASALVAEDNFMRASGDAAEFERAQRYAWETQERGDTNKQHLQANPTEGEYLRKKQKADLDEKKSSQKKALLEKYGGAEYLQKNPLKDAAIVENERYVEYDETGAIKGEPKRIAKSKYAEDVLINNHKSVWGSWWSNFQWGYACCHSTVKNSYCTGEHGREAFEQAEQMRTGNLLIQPEEEDKPAEKADDAAKPEHTAQAKKRTLTEMRDGISEEELEAYKRNRAAADDPMARFLGKDNLVG